MCLSLNSDVDVEENEKREKDRMEFGMMEVEEAARELVNGEKGRSRTIGLIRGRTSDVLQLMLEISIDARVPRRKVHSWKG